MNHTKSINNGVHGTGTSDPLLIKYKALNNLAPSYLRDLVIPYIPSRQLRSSSKSLLYVPRFNLQLRSYGARSSSVGAPTLWNTVCRSTLRTAPHCPVVKINLKLFILEKHFYNFRLVYFSPTYCIANDVVRVIELRPEFSAFLSLLLK